MVKLHKVRSSKVSWGIDLIGRRSNVNRLETVGHECPVPPSVMKGGTQVEENATFHYYRLCWPLNRSTWFSFGSRLVNKAGGTLWLIWEINFNMSTALLMCDGSKLNASFRGQRVEYWHWTAKYSRPQPLPSDSRTKIELQLTRELSQLVPSTFKLTVLCAQEQKRSGFIHNLFFRVKHKIFLILVNTS